MAPRNSFFLFLFLCFFRDRISKKKAESKSRMDIVSDVPNTPLLFPCCQTYNVQQFYVTITSLKNFIEMVSGHHVRNYYHFQFILWSPFFSLLILRGTKINSPWLMFSESWGLCPPRARFEMIPVSSRSIFRVDIVPPNNTGSFFFLICIFFSRSCVMCWWWNMFFFIFAVTVCKLIIWFLYKTYSIRLTPLGRGNTYEYVM